MKVGPSPCSLPCFSSSVPVRMEVDRDIFSMASMPHYSPSPDDLPPAPPPPPPQRPPPPPLFRVLRPGDDLADKANQMSSAGICMTTIAVCFTAVLLFVICYKILKIFYTRQRNSRRARSAPTIIGTQQDLRVSIWNWNIDILGLQQSVIDSIAVFTYKKDDLLIESTECCVCLNEFQEDESLRLLPKCRHAFHIPCIDAWLRSHRNCPLCRAPIVSDNFDAQSGFWWASSTGLGSREDTRVGNSQSGPAVTSSQLGEGAARNESGIEDGEFVVSMPVEEEEEAAAGNSKMSSSDSILRRSVSLDSSSAPAIYRAKRQVKSDSRSGQLESNRLRNEMRRVFSWSS